MGYDIENYPHPINTALVCDPQSLVDFQAALAMASENNCDALIAPIFADQYLQSNP